MRRAALERRRTVRVWLAHKRLIHADLPTSCICDEQPGRFRKGQRVAGCPNSRCICKFHKRVKAVIHRDFCAAYKYREWGAEYGFPVRMPATWW